MVVHMQDNCLPCSLSSGEELLPDYFLDEAEDFQAKWIQQTESSAPASTPPPSGTPDAVFSVVRTLLSPDIVAQVNATYHFALEGENAGHWLLDLKNNGGSVEKCEAGAEADVHMTTDSQLMVDMFQGKMSPTSAFMSGKLKLKGNMAAAMQLETLMGKMKSKL